MSTLESMGGGGAVRRGAAGRPFHHSHRRPLHSADRIWGRMKNARARPHRLRAVCALACFYLILPVLITVRCRFQHPLPDVSPPALSLALVPDTIGNAAWMQATRVTFTVAARTVVIATPLGVAAAYPHNSKLRVMRRST